MSKKTSVDLSICIVSFNTKDILRECLNSIYKNTKGIIFEIFIFDNDSSDGSVEMVAREFPKVKLTKNSQNLLWSKAINRDLKRINGRYFLILNPDTRIPPLALEKMVKFLDTHPTVSLASCKQVDNEGEVDMTCSRFPTPIIEILEGSLLGNYLRKFIQFIPIKRIEKLLALYRYADWKRNGVRAVEVISGAAMSGRKEVFEKIGYFDENLSLFYEEPDFCKRAKEAGLLIYHNGKVEITHLKAKSLSKVSAFQTHNIAQANMLYYYKKYFGNLWYIILWLAFRPDWLFWKTRSLR